MRRVKARDFVRYPTGTRMMNGAGEWVAVAEVKWAESNEYVRLRRAGSTAWEEYSPEDTFTVDINERY